MQHAHRLRRCGGRAQRLRRGLLDRRARDHGEERLRRLLERLVVGRVEDAQDGRALQLRRLCEALASRRRWERWDVKEPRVRSSPLRPCHVEKERGIRASRDGLIYCRDSRMRRRPRGNERGGEGGLREMQENGHRHGGVT